MKPSNTASLDRFLKSPKFWAVTDRRRLRTPGGVLSAQRDALATGNFFELNHPSFGMLKVQKFKQ